MLDLKRITKDFEEVTKALAKRGGNRWNDEIEGVRKLDEERKTLILEVETLKKERNDASQEIGAAKKTGKDVTALMARMKDVSALVKGIDERLAEVEKKQHALLAGVPNTPHEDVPAGTSAEQNVVAKSWGEPRKLPFPGKTHDEIGEKLGILDFKKAGEVTGARFVFLRGRAARLERALINFMIDRHRNNGYEEICPPFLVNRDSLYGTGTLPKFAEDVFHIEKFDLFLIPTAEVPVTNYHRQEILDDKSLPRKYVAYTPCFRSEAGSYGKDTKGMKRQHQFDKVEILQFARPEESEAAHEALTRSAEGVLEALELPYRRMLLCGGDMGFSSMKTFDLEVWCPGQDAWMEISSCSNFGDFQARRANIRYRKEADNKVHFLHTLNGSGLAIGRTLLAIMENFQTKDGDFTVPKALEPYL